MLRKRRLRRITGAVLVVAGAIAMWLAPESLPGTVLLVAGFTLEAAGLALERRADRPNENRHAPERWSLPGFDEEPSAARAAQGDRDRERPAQGGYPGGPGDPHRHLVRQALGRGARGAAGGRPPAVRLSWVRIHGDPRS